MIVEVLFIFMDLFKKILFNLFKLKMTKEQN